MIRQTNQAREQSLPAIAADVRDTLLRRLRDGMLVGLSDTTGHGTRPGERKARLLLEVLRDRPDDVLRFAHDLRVPPTSNQAERDLRPSKVQQKISGRLTSITRTEDLATPSSAISPPPPNTSVRGGCQGSLGLINLRWSDELLRGSAGGVGMRELLAAGVPRPQVALPPGVVGGSAASPASLRR